MKTTKRILAMLLCLLLMLPLWTITLPAQTAQAAAADAASETNTDLGGRIKSFFSTLTEKIKNAWDQLIRHFEVRREHVQCTKGMNAIHMLKSVEDTICDSFIITTEDGKVIVIDGGHKFETGYFLEYLKAVTGECKPHVDAWFLSHPHDDHVQVFYEVVENRPNALTFDKVLLNYAPVGFYEEVNDDESENNVREYHRLRAQFADKEQILHDGDEFSIGAAKFTVLYTFDPAFKGCNDSSFIARMDLAGTSVLLTGDAGVNAGKKTLEAWGDSGLLDCDYCKMAHHGQDGVDRDFYEAVSPEVCLWPTPSWVWDNRNGNLQTLEVRAWMEELGVQKNYVAMNGSAVIYMKPRIVTTTDVFEAGYPAEQAIDRLAALGYDGIDMGFDYWVYDETSPFLGDGYLDWARSLKARADEKGIVFTHAHAPGEADAGEVIGRSIEAAAALGARYLVVHPIWHDKNGNTINSRLRFISVNAKAIRQWLPKAEECGVILLSENILWGASKDPRAIAELVKAVDSPWFGWCFDVGHAYCSGYQPDILKKCSVVPLSLHIQDNDGSGDGHLIPGDGTIDFDLFLKTLKDIGYAGDCVMEAHHQSLVAPDEERDAILARLLDVSKQLRDNMR
ncbi:MAG: TIM barrel protein [Clostridia bacterium]|nr:TIM barrel protein [Clostridia bacterium]